MDTQAAASSIAIIGMTGRFPGARNLDEFWENLLLGRESISEFSSQELDHAGVSTSDYKSKNYRPFAGVCPDADLFDATLFGYSARDAQIIDPNQRIMLQLAWETLEGAGYNPLGVGDTSVGVFAGQTINTYAFNNLLNNKALLNDVSAMQILVANDKDYLATRCSYKLGLSGPSITVQTACSTSLVAVHLACQSLLVGDCYMALAGAVSVKFPQEVGYFAVDGDVLSFDGHCRAFDSEATGTVPGNGAGLVLLKRLEDAQADGDRILAVIRGSAINNDGQDKVSFTSPNVTAQAAVIRECYAVAGVAPESIGFLEAHGTGTSIGDPIELAALSSVFREGHTPKSASRFLGSVKSNIGHLDTAAGIAGLIKAVLAVKNAAIPPTLHWRSHNKNVDVERLPFEINSSVVQWNQSSGLRRAGISSFGFGGTNAHIVIEQAPAEEFATDAEPTVALIPLSAATAESLSKLQFNLAVFLKTHRSISLSNIASTLQFGRAVLPYRNSFVATSVGNVIEKLQRVREENIFRSTEAAFLFSGQGTRAIIDESIYEMEPTIRDAIDRCAEILLPELGYDIRTELFKKIEPRSYVSTAVVQPALFTLEYALVQLWRSYGIQPTYVIGHSLGEYVAAQVAGVLSLEDALRIVANRGRLMERLKGGAMLSVLLSEAEISGRLPEDVSVAAVNGPNICVVSGPSKSIDDLSSDLLSDGISNFSLTTSYAFHSAEVDPILDDFRTTLQSVKFNTPSIPFVSTLTGKIVGTELCNPNYWIEQTRKPVRFHAAVSELARVARHITLIEIGTDQTLAKLAKLNPLVDGEKPIVSSLLGNSEPSYEQFLSALSSAWETGLDVRWNPSAQRQRIYLPTYPFGPERHWIERQQRGGNETRGFVGTQDERGILSTPVWERSVVYATGPSSERSSRRALLVAINSPESRRLQARLAEHFYAVDFFELDVTNPEQLGGLLSASGAALEQQLLASLQNSEYSDIIFRCEGTSVQPLDEKDSARSNLLLLISIVRATAVAYKKNPVRLVTVTQGLFEIGPDETSIPSSAALLGPILTAPREYPHLSCFIIDAALEKPSEIELNILASEISYLSGDFLSVLRGKTKWRRRLHQLRLDEHKNRQVIRNGGTFLITGGGGHIGSNLSDYLVRKYGASVVLMGRSIGQLRTKQKADEKEVVGASALGKLLALGEKVTVVPGDVTSRTDVKRAIQIAKSVGGGRIDGIFHLAGVSGNSLIEFKTEEEIDRVLSPKVSGTIIISEEFAREDIDFIVFFGSLSTFLPTLGQADYASANAFQSHFARRLATSTSAKVVSVAWDWWATRLADELGTEDLETDERLSFSEAFSALEKALESNEVEFVASKRTISTLNNWNNYNTLDDSVFLDAATLTNPHSSVGDQILAIWRRVLGSNTIDLDDDFIAAGGHSLSAMRIISHVQQLFRINLPFREVFQSMRTVRAMSIYISETLQLRAIGENDKNVEALASEILEMSETEIKEIIRGVEALG